MYCTSLSVGGIFTFLLQFVINNTPKELCGLSIGIWLVAFIINMIDIRTGIKADTKRKQEKGEKFVFESEKGWRAFQKIFVFSAIIYVLYTFEKEVIRLGLWEMISTFLLYIKLGAFAYVVLVELQSIGENEEARFGKKSRMFVLLDQIIEIINEGLLTRLRTFAVGGNKNTEE